MLLVRFHTIPQRFGIFERCQRSIDPANNIAEKNLSRRSLQLVSTVCATNTGDKTRTLKVPQNSLQELLWQLFLLGDVANFHHIAGIMPRKHNQSLQSI